MTKLNIFIYDQTIIVQNKNGKQKRFPRCGITDIEAFVKYQAEKGNLNELLV
ncbi:MAG: hypothetical protein R3327_01840 [Nitrosopumilaceae archaeon]|nr:hypothetical protein [Nitrosopumilaceae archaeon]